MSDNDDYRPIDCGLHSELELLAMRRQPVTLILRDGEAAGRVVDLVVRDGAEYLVLESAGGRSEIRLDRIGEVCPTARRRKTDGARELLVTN